MNYRNAKYFFLFVILLFSYSNCSQFSSNLDLGQVFRAKNGTPYDGMSNGYYRYIPNYSCSGSPEPLQIASLNGDVVNLISNGSNQCSPKSEAIPISQVSISPFENEFISIKDALFEQHLEQPNGIPNNLAEILCRDNFQSPKFEIVAHYDIDSNQAVARVYFSDAQKNVADFPVSRILSSSSVQYVSNQLSFNVDLSKPAQITRKFAGTVSMAGLKDLSPQAVTCVIGGALDTSNWSFNQVSPLDTAGFQVFDNGQYLLVAQMPPPPAMSSYFFFRHLFSIGADGLATDINLKNFGPNSSFQGYMRMKRGDYTVFSTSSDYDYFISNYLYNSTNGQLTRLTNLHENLSLGSNQPNEAYIQSEVEMLNNGHLIFDVQTIMPQTLARSPDVLRDFDINANTYFDFAKDAGFTILSKLNKVLWYAGSNSPNSIAYQIYDPQNQSSQSIVIPTPNCTGISMDLNVFKMFNDEQSVITTLSCNGGAETELIIISLKDQTFKVIAKNKGILWTSDDKQWILLGDYLPQVNPINGQSYNSLMPTNTVIYGVSSGLTWPAPMNPQFNVYSGPNSGIPYTSFSSDFTGQPKIAITSDQYLYGLTGDLNAPTLNQVNLTNGKVTSVCENALGLKLFVSNFTTPTGSSPNAYLFSYDTNLKVYHFYRISGDGTCARLNEFPSNYQSVVQLITTNIGFALTTNPGNLQPSVEAIFVPINGQPPLMLNNNMRGASMQISADRNKIYLNIPDPSGNWPLYTFDITGKH